MTDDSHFRTKRSLRGERDSATSATEGVFLLTFRNEVLYNTGEYVFFTTGGDPSSAAEIYMLRFLSDEIDG